MALKTALKIRFICCICKLPFTSLKPINSQKWHLGDLSCVLIGTCYGPGPLHYTIYTIYNFTIYCLVFIGTTFNWRNASCGGCSHFLCIIQSNKDNVSGKSCFHCWDLKHTSGMALWMAVLVWWSVHHFGPGWYAVSQHLQLWQSPDLSHHHEIDCCGSKWKVLTTIGEL